jgi:hypothetical protein
LGTKVNKFLKAGADSIEYSTEKNFVQRLGISTSTYQDIKKRILKEIMNDKDPRCKASLIIANEISKQITTRLDLDRDVFNQVVDFVIKLKPQNNI